MMCKTRNGPLLCIQGEEGASQPVHSHSLVRVYLNSREAKYFSYFFLKIFVVGTH